MLTSLLFVALAAAATFATLIALNERCVFTFLGALVFAAAAIMVI